MPLNGSDGQSRDLVEATRVDPGYLSEALVAKRRCFSVVRRQVLQHVFVPLGADPVVAAEWPVATKLGKKPIGLTGLHDCLGVPQPPLLLMFEKTCGERKEMLRVLGSTRGTRNVRDLRRHPRDGCASRRYSFSKSCAGRRRPR